MLDQITIKSITMEPEPDENQPKSEQVFQSSMLQIVVSSTI